jgi:SAM-dependent methyltransferase
MTLWNLRGRGGLTAVVAMVVLTAGAAGAQTQGGAKPFVPESGQAGKDVVWVPTPAELVEKMLDLAKVTASDFVMDLGSGDGRNIIAAAKRGARSLGVEYNQDMVDLSNRLAREAGVTDKAQFVQGDMYVADISKANVMALFLLPTNLTQLRPKFLDLQPGSRIVSNTFTINDWTPDDQVTIAGDCSAWCTALLYIVPARVAGTWKTAEGELTLKQDVQMLTGTLARPGGQPIPVTGRLLGTEITLQAQGQEMKGRVTGGVIDGTRSNGTAFQATRIQ